MTLCHRRHGVLLDRFQLFVVRFGFKIAGRVETFRRSAEHLGCRNFCNRGDKLILVHDDCIEVGQAGVELLHRLFFAEYLDRMVVAVLDPKHELLFKFLKIRHRLLDIDVQSSRPLAESEQRRFVGSALCGIDALIDALGERDAAKDVRWLQDVRRLRAASDDQVRAMVFDAADDPEFRIIEVDAGRVRGGLSSHHRHHPVWIDLADALV